MSLEVTILADSISPQEIRLTTFELYYGHPFHPEVLTHRDFSRNGSSSRAIPWKRMKQAILDDPWVPLIFGTTKAGMQMGAPLVGDMAIKARDCWLRARDSAIAHADELIEMGVHKSIVNRVIEPYAHIRVVLTATEWDNYFGQRCDVGALPDFQQLAIRMLRELDAGKPTFKDYGEWHLPYIDEKDSVGPFTARYVSTARCARASYRMHDNTPTTIMADVDLFERLLGADPKHPSPSEHQATPAKDSKSDAVQQYGNLRGWKQLRKMIKGERITNLDRKALLAKYDGRDYLLEA